MAYLEILLLLTNFGSKDDAAYAVAEQPDGKIVVAGASYNGASYDIAVARYLNGNLDNTFSGNGKITQDIAGRNDYAYAAAVQQDGKIVVAGATYNGSTMILPVLRYLVNGTPDNSFGTGGVVKTGLIKGSNDYGKSPKDSDRWGK
jgi:uncharacterized delta-60 repeat protein